MAQLHLSFCSTACSPFHWKEYPPLAFTTVLPRQHFTEALSDDCSVLLPGHFLPKDLCKNNISKKHISPHCSRQTFETHQDAVENQRAEWKCIFLQDLLPCCPLKILCCCLWHFPEGSCLNDKQVKGQDSFKKNKSSQKILKGLSTAAEKYPPGVKGTPQKSKQKCPLKFSNQANLP